LERQSNTNSPGGRVKRIIALSLFGGTLVLLPIFIQSPYQMHLLIMTGINIMLALSFSILFSSGLVTIGAAAFWAIGAYSSALLVMKAGLSFWFSLPLSGIVAGLVALIAGLIVVTAIAAITTVGTKVLAKWNSLGSSL